MKQEVFRLRKKLFLFTLLSLIIILPLVFAGLFDQAKSFITGKAQTETTSLSLTVGNSQPVITSVEIGPSQTVNEGGTVFIPFNFTALDTDGIDNLDDATARAQFNRTTEPLRPDPAAICSHFENISATERKYNCTIGIEFYDQAGDWTVNVTIKDNSSNTVQNLANTFTVNPTRGMKMTPASLSCATQATQAEISRCRRKVISQAGSTTWKTHRRTRRARASPSNSPAPSRATPQWSHASISRSSAD